MHRIIHAHTKVEIGGIQTPEKIVQDIFITTPVSTNSTITCLLKKKTCFPFIGNTEDIYVPTGTFANLLSR